MNKARKRSFEPVNVDGYQLGWVLRRQPKWSTDQGYIGAAISVERIDAVRRELILEYHFSGTKLNGMAHLPERTKFTSHDVVEDIRAAMADGWDPNSRGRPFIFQVPQKP